MLTLIRLLTAFIPGKRRRAHARLSLKNYFFSRSVRRRARYFGKGVFIGGRTTVNKDTEIGNYSSMYNLSVYGDGPVTIGEHVVFGPNIVMQTQSHNYEGDLIPFDHRFNYKPIVIEDFVWIGMNVMILPGTRIGEGAIIQMGAVVHGDIPAFSIAGGNPAKVFSWRDRERFEKLKSQGEYLATSR